MADQEARRLAAHERSSSGPTRRRAPGADEAAGLLRVSGGVFELPVRGNSMSPVLEDGDTARVLAGAPPRIGDVVVAQTRAGLVIHRVVRVDGARVLLHGDNVPRRDQPIDIADVLGRVVAVDGGAHRRLDGGSARPAGRAIAAYASARLALGNRPARPRPARVASWYQTLVDATVPRGSIEDRVTLSLASPGDDPNSGPGTSLLDAWPADLHWGRVADRALLGQIGPQVYANARRLTPERAPPAPELERLRLQLLGNVARTRRAAEILDAILARLDEVGVRALAHKGVALAASVYRDPALRIMGDIDLSVRDEDRTRAENAAHEIRSALANASPDRRDPGGFHVELDGTAHHDLDPALFGGGRWRARSLDWDGIWTRARPTPIGAHEVLVPCPTDLLLTVIANSVRRGFSPVRLIVDVAQTIVRHEAEIDWSALWSELARTGLDRRSWLALQLAVSWCGAPVPVRMLEPPVDLSTSVYERALLNWKRESPFARLPTRVLWAGSWRGAAGEGVATMGRQLAGPLR